MGVVVTGRDYENGYRPEVVNWMIGGVKDWQKLTIEAEFSVIRKYSDSSPLLVTSGSNILKNADGTHWSDYGFEAGDQITIEYNQDGVGFVSNTRNILLLNGDELYHDGVVFAWSISQIPTNNGTTRVYGVSVWADKQPEGANVKYGHIPNDDIGSGNLSSVIDGTNTLMEAIGMDTVSFAWNQMNMIGYRSGMSIESARWMYAGKTGNNIYTYRFEIVFMISLLFDDVDNLSLNEKPEAFDDDNCLTDNFQVIGFPKFNNPNLMISSDLNTTKKLGNTGWFGENNNGLNNDFTVVSVDYEDVLTSAPVAGLSYGSEIKVKAVISGVDNLANGLSLFGLGFAWTPEDEDHFHNKNTPFHKNLLVNTGGSFGSGIFALSAAAGATTYQGFTNDPNISMNVRNVHFYQQGLDLVYEAIWSPSVGFKAFIDSLDVLDRGYEISISVADRTLETNFSNRVPLLVGSGVLELFTQPVGAWNPMKIEFFEHPEDGSGLEDCSFDMFIEDDVLAKVSMGVDVFDVVPESLKFVIEAERISDGIKYELESYSVNLTGYGNNSFGVPQWNFDDVRGFKLEAGNSKNWVKVLRDSSGDSLGLRGYVAYYGFKIRWEDWILRSGVPSDFFDILERNNGLNNDWYSYLINAGWKLNFTVYTGATVAGDSVVYDNSKEIIFRDYDSNTVINSTWNFYRVLDNSLLNIGLDPDTGKPLGVIIDGEEIRIEIIYERTSGTWDSIGDVYALNCIEGRDGSGYLDFRQLSSIFGREADNYLVPLAGETKLKLTLIDPTHVSAECLIDPSLIPSFEKYKVSGRIGCL